MNKHPLHAAALAVIGSALLAACGGGGHADLAVSPAPAPGTTTANADVTVSVPAEVATSATAATTYVAALSNQPASTTDTLDPVAVPDQMAQDDTAEPQ